MSQEILLSKSNFELYADVSDQETEEKLQRYTLRAQRRFLLPLLCDTTYSNLITGYKAQNLNSDYKDLLGYVRPFLAARTYELYLPQAGTQATAAGLKAFTGGEFAESLDPNLLQLLINDIRAEGDSYEKDLINYLNINEDTFTEWRDSNCNCKRRDKRNFSLSAVTKEPTVKTRNVHKKYYPYNDGNCIDC